MNSIPKEARKVPWKGVQDRERGRGQAEEEGGQDEEEKEEGQFLSSVRGHPLMMSAKFLDYLTPSPLVRKFTQPHLLGLLTMSAFEGTPLPPSVRTS